MKIGGYQYCAVLLVLILLASYPVFSVSQPPLADYPNHLARVHVWLSHGTNNAVPNVEPVMALQPNMAFELVVGLLASILPLEQAGRIFVILTVVSIAVGSAVLGRVLWGGFSPWSFLPVFLIYNRLFFWGFLGYLFSLGVALALSSIWVNSDGRKKRGAWFILAFLSALLVLSLHLYAYAVFCIVVFVLTIRGTRHLTGSGKAWAIEVCIRLAPLMAVLPVFALGAPVFESEHAIEWGPFWAKLVSFAGLFVGPNQSFDLVLGGVTLLILGLLLFGTVLRINPDKWLVGGVVLLLALHLAMPAKLMSSYGADQRLPIAIFLFLAASIPPPEIRRPHVFRILAVALVLVFAARMVGVKSDWSRYQKFHSDLISVYQKLPRQENALAIVGTSNPYGLPEIPLTEHFGFAVIERSVFWPGLFAYPVHGAQTIEFLYPDAISSSIAKLQKVPLPILNEVLTGVRRYQDFDLNLISSCYRYIVVIREDGKASTLPDKTVFGSVYHRGDVAAIYFHSGDRGCDWQEMR